MNGESKIYNPADPLFGEDDEVLVPAPSVEKMRAATQMQVELEMLREFYDCWEALHRLAKQVAVPRRMKENAAQRLVDAAGTIRSFRAPVQEPEPPKLEIVKS